MLKTLRDSCRTRASLSLAPRIEFYCWLLGLNLWMIAFCNRTSSRSRLIFLGNHTPLKPLQFCRFSLSICNYSFSMPKIIHELSLVDGSIFPAINSITMFFIIFILSFISIILCISSTWYPNSISISTTFSKFSLVFWAVYPCINP